MALYGDVGRFYPIKFKFAPERSQPWEDGIDIYAPRMRRAAGLPIKHLPFTDVHDRTFVIVGAGPTMPEFVDEIGRLDKSTHEICSLNATHEFLIKNGIGPSMQIIFENDLTDVRQALGGLPNKETTYYICSHCHENIYEQLRGFNCVLYHVDIESTQYRKLVAEVFPNEPLVGASVGYVTFFRSMALGHVLGFRNYKLYGIDSSFEDESDHINGYNGADSEPQIHVWGRKKTTGEMRKFKSNGGLAYQAYRFINLCDGNRDLKIKVYGDSLLRFLHQGRYPEVYRD